MPFANHYLVFYFWSIREWGTVPLTSCLVKKEIFSAPKEGVHPRHTVCAPTTLQGGDGAHEPATHLYFTSQGLAGQQNFQR